MKIVTKEVNYCGECPYIEDVSFKHDLGFCSKQESGVATNTIDVNCPFEDFVCATDL